MPQRKICRLIGETDAERSEREAPDSTRVEKDCLVRAREVLIAGRMKRGRHLSRESEKHPVEQAQRSKLCKAFRNSASR